MDFLGCIQLHPEERLEMGNSSCSAGDLTFSNFLPPDALLIRAEICQEFVKISYLTLSNMASRKSPFICMIFCRDLFLYLLAFPSGPPSSLIPKLDIVHDIPILSPFIDDFQFLISIYRYYIYIYRLGISVLAMLAKACHWPLQQINVADRDACSSGCLAHRLSFSMSILW
jgi:hypothetical protein